MNGSTDYCGWPPVECFNRDLDYEFAVGFICITRQRAGPVRATGAMAPPYLRKNFAPSIKWLLRVY